MSQEEFAELSYAVMRCVFDVHNEFGRFFQEKIYKRELVSRLPGVEIEFPIAVTHRTFSTTYYLDALVADGGVFEFKAVETLADRHRRHLYNYLLMLDLAHGKLVNLRLESVEHEFVNAMLRTHDRLVFEVCTNRREPAIPASDILADSLIRVLRDWGTGLELSLYESAIMHLLGGAPAVIRNVAVRGSRQTLGHQPMRLAAPGVAFKPTAFDSESNHFEEHARRLLAHTDLRVILWVNIGLHKVTFVTIQ